MGDGESFYTPGRIKLCLWRYKDLVQLVSAQAGSDSNSQRLPRDHPTGAFEAGAAIKADLDCAFAAIEPALAKVVWAYYVVGYASVEIAVHMPGANRWFVDRARHRGIKDMALYLKDWTAPAVRFDEAGVIVEGDRDPGLSAASLQERMRQVVARAFNRCPVKGPPGFSCPVIDCRGWFDPSDGYHHVGERFVNSAA